MTWVSDIFSAIGPGTVGAAAAAAVYAGASATDKEARKEAKHDIAMFLIGFHTKFELSLISGHISHAFEIIFGPRHFSARCILRSILTTFVFSTVALAMIHLKHSPDIIGLAGSVSFTSNPRFNQWIGEGVIYTMLVGLACIIPDYLSLWKSRILLRWLHLKPKIWHLLVLVPIDVILSFYINFIYLMSIGSLFVYHTIEVKSFMPIFIYDLSNTAIKIIYAYRMLLTPNYDPDSLGPGFMLIPLLFTSTILTSIWTLSVLASAVIARCLLTLRFPLKILTWLFNVKEQPIKIIGMIFAALTWITFMLYGLL